MPAGRPRKPVALKALEGNPGKRPEPTPALSSTQVAKLPRPPRELSLVARREWRRLGRQLEETGRITEIMLRALQLLCTGYDDWMIARQRVDENGRWHQTTTGYWYTTPWTNDERKYKAEYLRLLREFGLTPASSEKVPVAKQDEPAEDPASAWMRGVS